MEDRLVKTIFDAIKNEPVSSSDRQRAIVRAGRIAELYSPTNEKLYEGMFGSGQPLRPSEDDVQVNSSSGVLQGREK